MKHFVVIGAGISGLAAAYRLHKAGARVTLLEAASRVGGVIHTIREQGCLLEAGPDCWAGNKPAALELATELGLADQVIDTREGVRRSFILHKGTLKRLPEGFFLLSPMSLKALWQTDVLSLRGKLRMALELIEGVRHSDADESLAGFVRRRFGHEALARIAQPMIAGIYTADPEKLSLKATFPDFLRMEREHGSVIKALRKRKDKQASGPRYSMFKSLKGGVGALTDALAGALPEGSLRLNTPVTALTRAAAGWLVQLEDEQVAADAIVLALPAHACARLLRGTDGALADALGAIEYAGAAVVNFIFERSQIGHALDGMGAVIPAIEGRKIIAISFSSVKFEGRAPDNLAVVRVFMGGALQPDVAGMDASAQVTLALAELRQLIGVSGEPKFALAASHPAAMAQYHVGHLDRVAEIRRLAAAHDSLALIGNGFDGVGIPDCIRHANDAAARLTRA